MRDPDGDPQAPRYVHLRTGAKRWELPRCGDPAACLPEDAQRAWVERQVCEGGRQWTYYFNLHTLDIVSHELPKGHTTVRGPEEAPDFPLAPRLSEHLASPEGRYLQVGAAVLLWGLRNSRHMNGQTANVLKLQGEKATVQLPRELGGRIFAVPWGCARPLQEGAIVELKGLKENHEFNGRRGNVVVCGGFLEGLPQYTVRLDDGSDHTVDCRHLLAKTGLFADLAEAPPTKVGKKWQWERLCNFVDSTGRPHQFKLYLPTAFWESLKEVSDGPDWPLLVYMHGRGGGSFFDHSKKSWRTEGLQFAFEHFVVVSPVCMWDWKDSPQSWVLELVRQLRAASWLDHRRVYLTGCSMGGMGAWEVGASAPEVFAAVAPVAAHHKQDMQEWMASRLCRTPMRVYHARHDDTCPMFKEVPLWNLMKKKNMSSFQEIVMDDCNHMTVYDAVYCNTSEFFRWLLHHETP